MMVSEEFHRGRRSGYRWAVFACIYGMLFTWFFAVEGQWWKAAACLAFSIIGCALVDEVAMAIKRRRSSEQLRRQ